MSDLIVAFTRNLIPSQLKAVEFVSPTLLNQNISLGNNRLWWDVARALFRSEDSDAGGAWIS